MKTLHKILITFLSVVMLAACDKEGDLIYLSGHESSDLIATETDVVLSQENSTEVVLSFAWTTSTLVVSDDDMKAPDVLSAYLQVSDKSDFSGNIVESPETSLSHAFTGAELNTVAKNLNVEADVAVPLYFRLRSSVGSNIESLYSNAVTVNVTSYTIDMSKGFILDKGMANTGAYLSSPTSNGVYTGFMGATGWYNFYIQEGDGVTWGNEGEGGTPFLLSSENDDVLRYNCWFPGVGGCYYVNFDTNRRQWSSLLLPTLSATGGIEANLTFDRPNVKWTAVFNAATAGQVTIQLSTTGRLYDYTTGPNDDTKAIETPVAFAQENGNLVMAGQPGAITVNIPQAGECTLVIDLSNPDQWTCTVTTGSDVPEPVVEQLYLPGVDDGTTGSWTFDNYISLWNEDEKAYAGVVNVNSLYGFQMATEEGNWEDYYGVNDEGELEWTGSNIPAPAAGLYLIQASLKDFTYSLMPVGNEIYAVGLDDKWEFNMPLAATSTPGVYSGPITFAAASEWGFQIHLNTEWGPYFGGSEGKLYFSGQNITDDATLAPGTYTLTVDLINKTYTIE